MGRVDAKFEPVLLQLKCCWRVVTAELSKQWTSVKPVRVLMTFGKRLPPGYRGIDRRGAASREPVDIPAEILVPGADPMKCRIVDLSDTGARLSLESILGVPEEFELRAHGETGRVKVVRRATRSLAVIFI